MVWFEEKYLVQCQLLGLDDLSLEFLVKQLILCSLHTSDYLFSNVKLYIFLKIQITYFL